MGSLPPAPDRLSALDQSFLALDSAAAPLHVGWTMRFDGTPPPLAALRRHLEQRLAFVPRFRRRVTAPALGDPRWVDDPGFDVARHVHELTVAAPGSAAELRDLAGLLLSRPLDPARPLWQLYLVRGLAPDGFALVGQAHHALVDGIAAIEVAALLFTPDPPATDGGTGGPWRPQPHPSGRDTVTAALTGRARTAGELARASAGSPSVRGTARRAAGLPGELRTARDAMAGITGPLPATVLNRGAGPRRAVAYARAPIDELKAAGRRHSATLNDVLLAACAPALRRVLAAAGEHPGDVRVMVPVSTRDGAAAALGNQISFVAIQLPVDDTDPVGVLRTVRDRTSAAKAAAAAGSGLDLTALVRAADVLPASTMGAAARLAYRAAAFHTIVSNVPGPEVELSVLGRPLRAVYPAVPVAPGHALSVGALSYLGALHVGLSADADVLGDVTRIGWDLERALDALRAQAPDAPTPWGERARSRRAGGRTGQPVVRR